MSSSRGDAATCVIDETTGLKCGDFNAYITLPQGVLETTVTSAGQPAGGIATDWSIGNPAIGTTTLNWTTTFGQANFQVDAQGALWAVFDGASVAGATGVLPVVNF
jgi:hypothetical protein